MTELERIADFVRALRSRAAGREEPFPFGVAHFHQELPRVRSRNYLVAEKNLDAATAELLAWVNHRKVEGRRRSDRRAPGARVSGAGDEFTFLMADRDDWPRDAVREARLRRDRLAYEFIRPSTK